MSPDLRPEHSDRFAAFLAHQRICVLSTVASQGVWTLPVWYRPHAPASGGTSLEVDCLVPRWTDVAHHLVQDARVVLIVQASSGAGLRWLQIQGTARPIEAPRWDGLLPRWARTLQPDALYLVVRITPSRIDLVDEEFGWGVQETLEW